MLEPTILVVDDEPAVRTLLNAGLSAEGWTVHEAKDRGSMMDVVDNHPIDLITLDLMLGAEDGLELARELRRIRNLPIVMISGMTAPFDRVQGLEAGADDYIVKPFLIREIVLRLRKTLDRYGGQVALPVTVHFEDNFFDARRRIVRDGGGDEIELTNTETILMQLFLGNPQRVLSRDEISNALHGREWSPTDRTIDVHIANLRRKVDAHDEKPLLIRSVRGVGYVFGGTVQAHRPPS